MVLPFNQKRALDGPIHPYPNFSCYKNDIHSSSTYYPIDTTKRVSTMNQNQSGHLAERVSGILASFGGSSDVKTRYLKLPGGHFSACLLYIENIVDTMSIQEHIIEPLLQKPMPDEDEPFFPFIIQEVLQISDIEIVEDMDKVIDKLVNGSTIILFDGESEILSADTSKWEERSLSNPKGQRTVQGPDIGFTESRSGNVALIRKYIKNPMLEAHTETYGKITNTSVTLVYLENLVDAEILSSIKEKLNEMPYDSVIGSNYITEYLTKESKSLFPLILKL